MKSVDLMFGKRMLIATINSHLLAAVVSMKRKLKFPDNNKKRLARLSINKRIDFNGKISTHK